MATNRRIAILVQGVRKYRESARPHVSRIDTATSADDQDYFIISHPAIRKGALVVLEMVDESKYEPRSGWGGILWRVYEEESDTN